MVIFSAEVANDLVFTGLRFIGMLHLLGSCLLGCWLQVDLLSITSHSLAAWHTMTSLSKYHWKTISYSSQFNRLSYFNFYLCKEVWWWSEFVSYAQCYLQVWFHEIWQTHLASVPNFTSNVWQVKVKVQEGENCCTENLQMLELGHSLRYLH